MGRKKELTLWQLEVLVEAAALAENDTSPDGPAPTLTDVAASLGVSRQQVVGAIERLEEALVGDRDKDETVRIVEERDEGIYVARPDLVSRARTILEEFTAFRRVVEEGPGRWWLTVDGYWAHLSVFLADAILDLEATHPEVKVELAAQFGQARSLGGSGLVGRLQRAETDLVVAPTLGDEIPGIEQDWSHRVLLMAAVGPDHPIRELSTDRRLPVRSLAVEGFTVLTSPKGHFSRDLIDLYQGPSRQFTAEVVGPEPMALAALGARGQRVPIIASDSALHPLQPVDEASAKSVPDSWLYLVDDENKLLGRNYSVYHRTFLPKSDRRRSTYGDVRFVPQEVDDWLRALSRHARDVAAARLGPRDPWPDEPLSGAAPATRGRKRA